MANDVLLITQTRLSDTEPIVRAVRDVFDGPNVIIYAIGRKRRDFGRLVEKLDIHEVVYDYDVSKNRPNTVNRDYLKRFEQSLEEKSALNTCIAADRKLIKNGQIGLFNEEKSQFGYEETLSHVEARARILEELFEKRDFLFIFGRRTEVLAGMIAYQLSKRHDIPFFRRQHTRIQDKYVLHDNPYEYSEWFWEEFEKAKSEREEYPTYAEARRYIEQVRDGDDIYSSGTSIPKRDSQSFVKKLKYIIDLIKSERGGITTDYYYDTPKLKYFYKIARKRLNKTYLDEFCEFSSFNPDTKYTYFPLQAQPELSLMLWTKYFTGQRELMKYTAKSLPLHWELYVNDHPLQWGERKCSYYQPLENQYNISVLPVSINTRRIISNAEVVATITSSVGFEALVYGTPVVTFGREKYAPFYANFESVESVNNIYDLPKAIDSAHNRNIDDLELTSYVAVALAKGVSKSPSFYNNLFFMIKDTI